MEANIFEKLANLVKLEASIESRLTNLENTIEMLSKKIDMIESNKQKTNNEQINSKNVFELMEDFFNKNLEPIKGKRVITSDVLKKVNEYGKEHNMNFDKYMVSNFMKRKGYERKKIGSYNFYIDLDFIKR